MGLKAPLGTPQDTYRQQITHRQQGTVVGSQVPQTRYRRAVAGEGGATKMILLMIIDLDLLIYILISK